MTDNTPVVRDAGQSPDVAAEAWTREQIDLIKRMAAPGATDDELRLFLYQCKRLNLDPLLHHAYFIRRPTELDGQYQIVGTIQVGIDGLRLAAMRTGDYRGQAGPHWCGPDGQWQDVWLSPDPPAAARVGVYRHDWDTPVWGVARWTSYAQRRRDGNLTRAWARMPDLMIAKCAEALALRRAFPDALSGVYIPEEEAQWGPAPADAAGPSAPARLTDHVTQMAAALTPPAPGPAPNPVPSTPDAAPDSPPPPAESRTRPAWKTLGDAKRGLEALGVDAREIDGWIREIAGEADPRTWPVAIRQAVQHRLEAAWTALRPPDDGLPF